MEMLRTKALESRGAWAFEVKRKSHRSKRSPSMLDEGGAIMVFLIVCMPVVVGAVGFAIDMVRAHTLQTQLQRIADAAALAAANELDYRSDSFTRAEAAALALANKPSFATSVAGPQIITPIQFYSSIGDTDVQTSDPKLVQYVRVRTVRRTSAAWFIKIVGGRDAVVDAEAWAESRIMACGAAPLFFCVNKGFNPVRGTQLRLTYNSTYGPGNFGLLDPAGVSSNTGARLIEQNLAKPNPNFCYTGNLSVRTGSVAGPVNGGIGVRFDIYPTDNSTNSQTLRSYPPAPVVIKGQVPSGSNNANAICTYSDSAAAAKMPRDPCMDTSSCWQGNGAWQNTAAGNAYWDRNWGKLRPSSWATMTRYDTYLWELQIANENQTPQLRSQIGSGFTSPEKPAPACYTFKGVGTGPAATDARRRTINVATIDCETNIISGNSTPPLSVMRIARFFLTEPASGTGDIYAEFIELAAPGDGGIQHLVQLVR